MTGIEIAIAAVGAGGGVASAIAAFQSARAARSSTETSRTMTKIEVEREHIARTPRFHPAWEQRLDGILCLSLKFDGPETLDAVTVSIRNDLAGYVPLPGGLTRQEFDRTIYGPLRFKANADGVDEIGRTVTLGVMDVLSTRKLLLVPSDVPRRTSEAGWRETYRDQPLRLRIVCTGARDRPWVVDRDVEIGSDRYDAAVRVRA